MKGTNNWSFREVVQFLVQNGFEEIKVDGSHHIYMGKVDGITTLVEVQYHADVKGLIPQGTMQDGIVRQSRIPVAVWKAYTRLSPTLRKKYVYPGCKKSAK